MREMGWRLRMSMGEGVARRGAGGAEGNGLATLSEHRRRGFTQRRGERRGMNGRLRMTMEEGVSRRDTEGAEGNGWAT